jgi:flagellar biosynthetic protein FliR
MIRISGLVLLAPIISHKSFPKLAKIGFVVLFAIILVSALDGVTVPQVGSLIELAGLAFKELLVGAIIGFIFLLVFLAIQGAGTIAGYQAGLYMANAMDPISQTQSSLVSQIWFLLAMLVFLSINGHHLVIMAFVDSYKVIPPGYVQLHGTVGEMMIKYTAYLFVITLKVVSPVFITMFLTDVALGVLSKMLPTMNVFFVGFPVKIGVGLTVLAISLPVFAYVLNASIGYIDQGLHELFVSMGKA